MRMLATHKYRSFFTRSIAGLCLLLFCTKSFALNELFDLYAPPQVVAMGGAITADATGYLSNYYNPAGLAKAAGHRIETILLDFEGNLSAQAAANGYHGGGFGINRLFSPIQNSPGQYSYFKFSSVPSITVKNFGISFLANYQYAGLSDGTNIDMNAHYDLGPTVGLATSVWGNRLKFGIDGKLILRNELNGVFPLASFTDVATTNAMAKEGLGAGADLGMILELPAYLIPTLGVAWKDALVGTQFTPVKILNPAASGTPDAIAQSLNTGISIHPIIDRAWRATVAVEVQHWERTDLPLQKRLHIGIQIQREKTFFIWLGANQLLPTGGIALRVPGGNFELATYAEDVGDASTVVADRRYLFRYTVSF
jgi:hypothetical protein